MSGERYQIYKSELRGLIERDQRRSFITFNEGNYQNESRNILGLLKQFSEHYLIKSRSLELDDKSGDWVLIPIEGELKVTQGNQVWSISPQELLSLSVDEKTTITNKNSTEISRFYSLQTTSSATGAAHHSFELEPGNKLVSLLENPQISLKMGVFSGRTDQAFSIPANKQCFITVINGAFEIQNRLLETNDSLLIENVSQIEFEALSENAIILVNCF